MFCSQHLEIKTCAESKKSMCKYCDNTLGNTMNSETVMSLLHNIILQHINRINSHVKLSLQVANHIVGGSTIEIYKLEDMYEVI